MRSTVSLSRTVSVASFSSVPENGSSTTVAMMLKVVWMTAMPAAFAALSINANGNTALMA